VRALGRARARARDFARNPKFREISQISPARRFDPIRLHRRRKNPASEFSIFALASALCVHACGEYVSIHL